MKFGQKPTMRDKAATVEKRLGATIVLQGSNDGVTYTTLKNIAGSDMSFIAAGYAEFSSAAAFIKPSISGGTAWAVWR